MPFRLSTPYSDHVAPAILDIFDAHDIFSYEGSRNGIQMGRLAAGAYHLEPLGHAFAAMMRGRALVDLGSGDPSRSVVAPILAQLFHARQYVGVDRFNVHSTQKRVSNELGEFSASWVRSDMLEFLVSEPDLKGSVIWLSGIDFLSDTYTHAIMGVLAARLNPGDGILIAPGTLGFEPARFGFEKVAESRNSTLYRKP